MKNEYRTMIYPFDVEAVPLLRHSKIISNLNFTNIVSPNGWGFTGKDASYADNGQPIGIIVDCDFDKSLENCDTIFFSDSSTKIDLNTFIYPKIIKAAENFKNIICTIELESEIFDKVSNICDENNTFFKYFTSTCNRINSIPIEKIYKISTPIIFVAGMCERTHKFEIQINLKENIEKMGYKVSQIGTRHYCELLGFHSFPNFMYSKDIIESEKVTLFNHYIKNIEVEEQPDVIIIGLPGGTMPFNYEFTNKFGILAYEISQAVRPDAVILSTLYENYESDFYKAISNSYKYKFGYGIDCYNISNVAVNATNSKLERSLQYNTMDWKFINEKKKIYNKLDTPVYNIFDIDDAKSMAHFIVNNLAEYGKIESI